MKQKATQIRPFVTTVLTIIILCSITSCVKTLDVLEPCEGIPADWLHLLGEQNQEKAIVTIPRNQHQAALVIDVNQLISSQFKVMVTGSNEIPTFLYTSGVIQPDSALQYRSDLQLQSYQYQSMTSYPQNNNPASNVLLVGGQDGTIPSNIILNYNSENEKIAEGYISLSEARAGHTATYLYDSQKILITGGSASTISELYDINTESITTVASLPQARYHHTATYFKTVNDSESVLIYGGSDAFDIFSTNETIQATIYNMNENVFSSDIKNGQTRIQHTATWLSDQFYENLSPIFKLETDSTGSNTNNDYRRRILITGGQSSSNQTLATAQFYDIDNNFFEDINNQMQSPRHSHTATLIPNTNGKVLIIGGHNGSNSLRSVEIYDPEKNAFEAFASELRYPRHGHSATYIPTNQQIFIYGGFNGASRVEQVEFVDLISTDCW